MFARKGLFSSMGRTAVMATVAAMALTVVEPSPWRVDGPSLQGRARSRMVNAASRPADFFPPAAAVNTLATRLD